MSDPDHPEISIEVYEAANAMERAGGLLGTTEVGAGRGLLLRGKQVHTIGMSFTIDTVYLARDGQILKVRTIKPWRFSPIVLKARWILELDGGAAARMGLKTGGYLVRQ